MQEARLCDILLSPYARMRYVSYGKKCGIKLEKRRDYDKKIYYNLINEKQAKHIYTIFLESKENSDFKGICERVLIFFEKNL